MGNRAPATVTTFAPRGQAKSTSIVALAPCVWIRVVGVGDQAELILLLLVSLRSVWLTPLFSAGSLHRQVARKLRTACAENKGSTLSRGLPPKRPASQTTLSLREAERFSRRRPKDVVNFPFWAQQRLSRGLGVTPDCSADVIIIVSFRPCLTCRGLAEGESVSGFLAPYFKARQG